MVVFEFLAAIFFTSAFGVFYDILYANKDPLQYRHYLSKKRLIFFFVFFKSLIILIHSISQIFKTKRSIEAFLLQLFFIGYMFFLIHCYQNSSFGILSGNNGVYFVVIFSIILWVFIFSFLITSTMFLIDYSKAFKKKETNPYLIMDIQKNNSFPKKIKKTLEFIPSAFLFWHVYFLGALTTVYVVIVNAILK